MVTHVFAKSDRTKAERISPEEASDLRRSRKVLEVGIVLLASDSDERRLRELPAFLYDGAPLRRTSATAGCRTNIRCLCCTLRRGACMYDRDSTAERPHQGSQTKLHLKPVPRMPDGRLVEHERDWLSQMQAPAATQGSVSSRRLQDPAFLRTAMFSPATCVALPL
jgi:hypothetical protein